MWSRQSFEYVRSSVSRSRRSISFHDAVVVMVLGPFGISHPPSRRWSSILRAKLDSWRAIPPSQTACRTRDRDAPGNKGRRMIEGLAADTEYGGTALSSGRRAASGRSSTAQLRDREAGVTSRRLRTSGTIGASTRTLLVEGGIFVCPPFSCRVLPVEDGQPRFRPIRGSGRSRRCARPLASNSRLSRSAISLMVRAHPPSLSACSSRRRWLMPGASQGLSAGLLMPASQFRPTSIFVLPTARPSPPQCLSWSGCVLSTCRGEGGIEWHARMPALDDISGDKFRQIREPETRRLCLTMPELPHGWMIWSGSRMRDEIMLTGFSIAIRGIGAVISKRTKSSAPACSIRFSVNHRAPLTARYVQGGCPTMENIPAILQNAGPRRPRHGACCYPRPAAGRTTTHRGRETGMPHATKGRRIRRRARTRNHSAARSIRFGSSIALPVDLLDGCIQLGESVPARAGPSSAT